MLKRLLFILLAAAIQLTASACSRQEGDGRQVAASVACGQADEGQRVKSLTVLPKIEAYQSGTGCEAFAEQNQLQSLTLRSLQQQWSRSAAKCATIKAGRQAAVAAAVYARRFDVGHSRPSPHYVYAIRHIII